MPEPYRAESANGGSRTVLLQGWIVRAVFVDAGHAELGERVARLPNEESEAKGEQRD